MKKKSGPIIVIEDDIDDQLLLSETFQILDYPNQVIFFSNGYEAIAYMEKAHVDPFLIISDINMPAINGFELRQKIYENETLKAKCIPYVFFTTSTQRTTDAGSTSAQGFFIKPDTMEGLRNIMRKIVEYWQECYSPSQSQYISY